MTTMGAWQRAGLQSYPRDSAWGKRMRCIRGAHAANAAIRASGRVPGAEAAAARREQAKRRREQASLGETVTVTATD